MNSDLDLDTLLQTAWSAWSHGEPQSAIAHCEAAVATAPRNPHALGVLGFMQHALGNHEKSEKVFAELTQLEPSAPGHWMNLGTARRGAGRLDDALDAYTRAASLGADTADFYFNVGLTHVDRKDYESGRVVLAQAAKLAPEDAETRHLYALCCYERVRTDEALAALEGWETLSGLTSELSADIGILLMKLGAPDRAEPAVRRAVAAARTDPRPLLALIQLLERTNRLVEAELRMRQLLSDPQSAILGTDLKLMRAQLAQRLADHGTAVALFGELLQECEEVHLQHLLQFPLAKSLDALQRHEEAFATLAEAHRSQIALLQLTAPVLTVRGAPSLLITRYGCHPDDVASWTDPTAPNLEDSPVFIVAFPRSGTTLLELTLDSHPMLVSMDEQPLVQNALDDLLRVGIAYPERMRDLTSDQLDAIRANYWRRARVKAALGPGQRLIDKNPLNILRLPVIRRVFPNAPIIVAVRHPCDVMLSCFMQHFRTPDFALLCGDLQALAVGYRRTFDFWYLQQALLRPRSMELRYESFVGRFEEQIREILDFLALPWDSAVLQPQNTARDKRFISTPSYSQVIEPVNTKGIGRWRAYERHFEPVLSIIEPYLERWGYEGLGSSNNK